MSDNAWPELSWDEKPKPSWLAERIKVVARHTRAFEVAMEQASSEDEIDLGLVSEELELWENCAQNAYMYVGLDQAKQIPKEDLPEYVEELGKVWVELVELRETILGKLGPGAAKLTAREKGVVVGTEELNERVGDLPSFNAEVNPLTGETLAIATFEPPAMAPVTAEELRLREAAQNRSLPEVRTLEKMLAHIPTDWVNAIGETLEIEDGDEELSPAARTAARRKGILENLPKADFLANVLGALDDDARALLGELLEHQGAMRYADLALKWGRDETDGFFWLDRPPSGPLACLRRAGLCYVGREAGQQLLVVPSDVAAALESALDAAGEPAEA